MSASSLSNSGSPRPDRHAARRRRGCARRRSRRPCAGCPCSLERATTSATGAKNGLFGTCSQLSKGIAISPICCMQPRNAVPYFCAQPLLGDGAGGHHRRRQPRRGAAAAARIAQAVLLQVGVVGVAGAEGLRDLAVVLAALVGVADQQADRRAGGLALVHAREDLDLVLFLALRDVAAGAGAAPIEVGLDVGFRQLHAGRAAVDHAADRRPVRLAEVGDREERAEGVAAHGAGLSQTARHARGPMGAAGAAQPAREASGVASF